MNARELLTLAPQTLVQGMKIVSSISSRARVAYLDVSGWTAVTTAGLLMPTTSAVVGVAVYTDSDVQEAINSNSLTSWDSNTLPVNAILQKWNMGLLDSGYGKPPSTLQQNANAWHKTHNTVFVNQAMGSLIPNYQLMDLNPTQAVGMYLGEVVPMLSGTGGIEMLVRFLFKDRFGWLDLKAQNSQDPLDVQ